MLTEYLIFVFVLGMCVQQAPMMWKEKSRYFRKWWNCVLTAMLAGFLISGLFFMVGLTANGGSSTSKLMSSSLGITARRILLIGNSFYSIFSVIFFCQVNSVVGPLQLSIIRMFKDICNFLGIFLGIFFAFTVGVRNLYSYSKSLELQYFVSNTTTPHMKDELGM